MLKKLALMSAFTLAFPVTAFSQIPANVPASTVAAAKSVATTTTATAGQAGGPAPTQGPGRKRAPIEKRRPYGTTYVGIGIVMDNVHGYTGLMPKVYFGYGSLFGRCKIAYLGGEIFGGVLSIPLSSNQYDRVQNVFGGNLMPGYMMNEYTLLFGVLGIEHAYYRKLKISRTGALLGVGFQTYVSYNWDFRGEYTYVTNHNLNQYSLSFIYRFC